MVIVAPSVKPGVSRLKRQPLTPTATLPTRNGTLRYTEGSAARPDAPPFGSRLDDASIMGHMRTVQGAQRHAHCSRNPALKQEHHLDALALRGRHLPSQRSFQTPHLRLADLTICVPESGGASES